MPPSRSRVQSASRSRGSRRWTATGFWRSMDMCWWTAGVSTRTWGTVRSSVGNSWRVSPSTSSGRTKRSASPTPARCFRRADSLVPWNHRRSSETVPSFFLTMAGKISARRGRRRTAGLRPVARLAAMAVPSVTSRAPCALSASSRLHQPPRPAPPVPGAAVSSVAGCERTAAKQRENSGPAALE